jgi:mono/diheme cytochrome c family protein
VCARMPARSCQKPPIPRGALANQAVRNMMMFCAVLVSVATFAATAVPQDKKPAHSRGSDPDSGLQLYKRYCAVCHGNDLKGNGPVSPEFKNGPSDLTTLAQRHGGKFPDAYVEDVLRNGVQKPAHGNTEMPIWGPLFATVRGTDPSLVNVRIVNLTNYIKSMQAK